MVRRFGGQFRMGEKTEGADAVVDADEDHAFPRKVLAVVDGRRSGTERESTAINPNQDGKFFRGGLRRRPDIYVEAVLAHVVLAVALVGIGTELIGGANAFPMSSRLRSAPAEVTDRWRSEWDAFENDESGYCDALHLPIFCLDD